MINQGARKLSRSARTAFFPVFRQARKRRCIHEEIFAVLEVVAIYALKYPIDMLFDTSRYLATVLSRLTWDCKLRQGPEPGAVMRKELSLSGV